MMTALALVTLAGCDKSEKEEPWNGEIRLSSGVTVMESRAAVDLQETALANTTVSTQNVGIYVEDEGTGTTLYPNMVLMPGDAGALTPASQMYYPATGNAVNMYAYYPRNTNWDVKTTAHDFAVAADQSEDQGYLASDLLWGGPASNPVARTKDEVELGFKHVLTKVKLTITSNKGTPDLRGAKVYITGTRPATTFRPVDGTITAAKDADDMTGYADGILVAVGTATDKIEAAAVIVPQTIDGSISPVPFIRIKLAAGGELVYKLDTEKVFTSGTVHEYEIAANLTELTVTSKITGWKSIGEPTQGTAGME